jgi:3-methyladenine DNA glycosylase AlkD
MNDNEGRVNRMDIFDTFRAAADPEKAAPMAAYMKNLFPFLGIPKPERAKLSKDFLKAKDKAAVDWDFVFRCWDEPEREFQYLAKDYLAKVVTALTAADIPNICTIAVKKSWWDSIDGLDTIVGDVALRYPGVNDTILAWSAGENIWLRRMAIDHQLGRKGKTDTALLERIITNNLGQTEFFINKAIGWSLREYSKTNPNWVREFIGRHREKMPPLSVREAGKYI